MSKRNRIVRLEPHQYRSFRFPPIVEPSALKAPTHQPEPSLDDEFGLGEFTGFDEFDTFSDGEPELSFENEPDALEESSGDIQQQYSQGFQLGMTKGYDEGVKEGLEKGQVQGFEQGLVAGQQQGIEQGKQEGKKAFVEAAKPFALMAEKLDKLFVEQERRQREQVCELVKKVSQQVIRCELTLQPQQILALVEETLETLPSEPVGIKVMMAQEEFSRIQEVAAEKIEQWNIVCDPTLRQGDCRIVTKNAEADAGCDQRLETCMESVKKHLLEEPAAELEKTAEPAL
ncbi:flagellar assembly protein H [Vibrio astriarenae]|uniref:Flagellar assembly protein FliH n=1 Tax=Vibrio astriarenae TaxID=1481923 RepID=A0A7Z2YEK5_9VIBR|nr:flagellar assembly protein FliH [Vibrio astriarenae]QIA64547.1 flagellar assembly protein H [Vibrio astriarenae]